MVQPGQAILNAIEDYENNRQQMIREAVAVKQHEMMTNLQTETIKKMDEDAMNLPAGQFNAEKYLEDFNTKSANLLNQFEDKKNRLRFQDMTTQIRGQLGLKANKYELRSLQESQKIATENLYSSGVADAYSNVAGGGDIMDSAPTFFAQADALKPSLSFSQQQDLEEKKGNYAVLTLNLRADQLKTQLMQGSIDIDEYTDQLTNSNKVINEYPLSAEQRVRANDIFTSDLTRTITIATNEKVKTLKENLDGYRLELIRTGKLPTRVMNDYAKGAKLDPSLQGALIEFDTIAKNRDFYNAEQRGDLRTMQAQLNRAAGDVKAAEGTGRTYEIRAKGYDQLSVDYNKALSRRNENFADFYKNDPYVKFLKSKDPKSYVSYMKGLAQQQGLDPDEIKLLDKEHQQIYKERFEKAGAQIDGPGGIRDLALGIDMQYGADADKIYSEILAGDKSPKLNALRYRKDPAFGKIWRAANMSDEEIKGRETYLGFTKAGQKAASKLDVANQLRGFYDTLIAQGATKLGARVEADTELGYLMQLSGTDKKEVGNILANRDFNYVKNGWTNLRVPKDVDVSNLKSKVRDTAFKKTLIKKQFANINITSLPFREADAAKVFSKDVVPKLAVGAASLVSPALVSGLNQINKNQKKQSVEQSTNDLLLQMVTDSAEMVNDETGKGVMFMIPTMIGGETLEKIPLRDKNGKIIKYTWRELETERIGL